MEEISVMDFLSVLWRRKKLFLITAAIVFSVSVVVALRWSNYRSQATVEVALPEVATQAINDGTSPTPETLADLRISYLQQKVLSTGSLVEIITKHNLYAGSRRVRPIAEIADAMRSKIKLDFVGSSSSSGKSASTQKTTIAFTISFDYSEPLLTQMVTNEIVSRFLDEDIKQRRGQAQETTVFLTEQIKTLEASLAEQEQKIAEFRAQYGETRPDALAFNQSAMTSIMMNMQSLDAQIASNVGNLGSLQAQLSSLDPYTRVVGEGQVLTTPTVQYRAAKSEYAALSAKYGPDHPDVIKARRQMQSLEKHAGGGMNTAPIQALIEDTQTQLAQMQKVKGPDNPDVQSLQTQLTRLKAQLQTEMKKGANTNAIKQDADNPAYLAVLAQIQSTEERSKALQAQKEALQEQMDKYQKAVIQNPDAERKMAELSRSYANTQERYRQLQAKKMESEMSETIEKDRVGQRLVMINPPELPTQTQPSRRVFLLAGFVLALLSGAGVVVGAQMLTQSVVGANHLASIVGVAPMIVIPHIATQAERGKVTRRQVALAGLVVIGLIVAFVLFSTFVMPLDVFFSVLSQKVGLY